MCRRWPCMASLFYEPARVKVYNSLPLTGLADLSSSMPHLTRFHRSHGIYRQRQNRPVLMRFLFLRSNRIVTGQGLFIISSGTSLDDFFTWNCANGRDDSWGHLTALHRQQPIRIKNTSYRLEVIHHFIQPIEFEAITAPSLNLRGISGLTPSIFSWPPGSPFTYSNIGIRTFSDASSVLHYYIEFVCTSYLYRRDLRTMSMRGWKYNGVHSLCLAVLSFFLPSPLQVCPRNSF
jgi:hypothetical protein